MKIRKFALLGVLMGCTLFLQGCFESEADKQADAAKKSSLFKNMYQRGLDERNCDFLNRRDPVALASCWRERDKKWTDVPSAYVGNPPPGVARSSKPYAGDDAPKVPML